jgi:hypothetical protein
MLTKHYVPDDSMKDPNFHPGELGDCSDVLFHRRHPNTTNQTVPAANLIANALMHSEPVLIVTGSACPYDVP